jgi:hypothetical protein
VVSIGTRVQVTDPITGHVEHFTILGAWDSDPAQGIISYLSPVAQTLVGHGPGEELDLEFEGARRHFRIDSIEAYAPAATPPLEEPPANIDSPSAIVSGTPQATEDAAPPAGFPVTASSGQSAPSPSS